MQTDLQSKQEKRSGLVRVGGAALLVAFAIHIFANSVLKEFPPTDPTLADLIAYFEAQAETWRIVHGMRYVAVACLALFFGGLVALVRSRDTPGGWEYVGLVGGALHLTNLFITNGIETFAFLDFKNFSEQPPLFWSVFPR